MEEVSFQWSYYHGARFRFNEVTGKSELSMNPYPESREGSWADAVEELSHLYNVPRCYPDFSPIDYQEIKKLLPAISGAIYPPREHVRRGARACQGVGLFIADVDNKAEPETWLTLMEAGKILAETPYACYLYTSFNHSEERNKFRIVVPLSRPVPIALYRQFTEWALHQLHLDLHRKAFDLPAMRSPVQIYFLQGSCGETDPLCGGKEGIALVPPTDDEMKEIVVTPCPGEYEHKERDLSWTASYAIDFPTLDLPRLIQDMGLEVKSGQPQDGGGFKYRCQCPWGEEHSQGRNSDDAFLIVEPEKWPRFGCIHSQHLEFRLRDVLELATERGMDLFQYADPYVPPEKASFLEGSGGALAFTGQSSVQVELPESVLDQVTARLIPQGSPAWAPEETTPAQIKLRLVKNERGVPKSAGGNLVTVLSLDPRFGNRFRLNEMTSTIFWGDQEADKHHTSQIQQILLYEYGMNFSAPAIDFEIGSQASRHRFHPVREYFSSLTWDSIDRIDLLLKEVLHVEGTPLYRSYITKTLVGAVKRVFEPGCKFDTLTILVSQQGMQKGRFWEALAGEYYGSPDDPDINTREAKMAYHSNLINEIQEVDKLNGKMDAKKVKALLTTACDEWRSPYDRYSRKHPRSFIFVGSANETEGLLVDYTGSRRWFVIRLPKGIPIDADLAGSMRDQIWAQAIHLYHSGYQVWLDHDEVSAQSEDNLQYTEENTIYELFCKRLDLIEMRLQANWGKGEEGITMTELLDVMGIDANTRDIRGGSISRKLGPAITRLGWTKKECRCNGIKALRWQPRNLQEIVQRPMHGFTQPPLGLLQNQVN